MRPVRLTAAHAVHSVLSAATGSIRATRRPPAHDAVRRLNGSACFTNRRLLTSVYLSHISMDLVLLGAPGSGKGTQAGHLRRELGLTHIASGDLFRDHLQRKTDLGVRASEYMARGALVPDPITIAMLRERVSQPDTVKGVLLDGFPRTMEQTIALNEMMTGLSREIDAVLYVEVPDEALVERLSGRLICRECQAPFHRSATPFRTCARAARDVPSSDGSGHRLLPADQRAHNGARRRIVR
jgi:adenylate kinase